MLRHQVAFIPAIVCSYIAARCAEPVTSEIARAFLVPEPGIAQRIVHAKRTLADARVPFEVPLPRDAERAERLESVLEVSSEIGPITIHGSAVLQSSGTAIGRLPIRWHSP